MSLRTGRGPDPGTTAEGRRSLDPEGPHPGAGEERDEDRDGPSGFESRVQQAQEFAAQMAVQSVATLAAAEGAVSAYAHATGNTWKPYVPPAAEGQGISRQAATARMNAFE